jgi:dolichol-phosphate mannosyltransferase
MKRISVVIPVYQAEGCLQELYERLRAALKGLSADYEILLVEDGGADRSWEIILGLSQKDPHVKGIRFSRNFGQHYGITAGLDHCTGDWVVVMDCDLQDRPEEIPQLYRKAQEGYDVVLAKRAHRHDGLFKRLSSFLFYKALSYFSDIPYNEQIGNFRIISKKVVVHFRSMREQLRFFGGMVTWLGFPTTSVEVRHDERFQGKSAYTFGKLWKLAGDSIIAYSDKPLRLSIRFGFFISTISLVYGLYIIYYALTHNTPVLGWSSLIVSLYFLGGIIIAILGIIGIYLGKTFEECKRRPLYVIDSVTGLP